MTRMELLEIGGKGRARALVKKRARLPGEVIKIIATRKIDIHGESIIRSNIGLASG